MRKNPPSPPLIDNDQTRLQWSSLQWRNWTLVQSGSNYLSLKLTTELSSTMVFFLQMVDAEVEEDGTWRFGVAFVGVGLLFTIGMGVVSVIISRGAIHNYLPERELTAVQQLKRMSVLCIWPTSYTQISQSAPTPPTLTLWMMGTGFSTARFTLSGTAQFSMVLRSLIGKASTMGKVVLHIFYVRSDQLNSHQFYV